MMMIVVIAVITIIIKVLIIVIVIMIKKMKYAITHVSWWFVRSFVRCEIHERCHTENQERETTTF